MAPVCDTVTVEDISESSIGISSITSSGGEEVAQVNTVIKNTIEGGEGESLTGTFSITVDGSEEHSEEVSLSPGEEVEIDVTIEGLTWGTYDVCASIGESESCESVTVEQKTSGGDGDGSDGSDGGSDGSDGDSGGDNGGDGSDDQDGGSGEEGEGSGMGGLLLGAAGIGVIGYMASKGEDGDQ